MKKELIIGIVVVAVILLAVLVPIITTGKNGNQTSQGSNQLLAGRFIGSCYTYLNKSGVGFVPHSCVEYRGQLYKDMKMDVRCTTAMNNAFMKSEWSTARCSTDSATGACRMQAIKSPGSQAIIFDFEERTDNSWCTSLTELNKGNFTVKYFSKQELNLL